MKKLVQIILVMLFGMTLGVLLMICLFTPEKTKYGEYTSPYLYWTSDVYFNKNFK